jgi:hypothetical protein
MQRWAIINNVPPNEFPCCVSNTNKMTVRSPCHEIKKIKKMSLLLVVRSQIVDLTPDPSFGHNLCFRCPNGSCEPIWDTYVLRAFQWYKELLNPLDFDPCNCFMKIWESTATSTPKVRAPLGVWGFIPSHSFTLLGAWDVIPKLPLGSPPLQALALVASPKLGLWHLTWC